MLLSVFPYKFHLYSEPSEMLKYYPFTEWGNSDRKPLTLKERKKRNKKNKQSKKQRKINRS